MTYYKSKLLAVILVGFVQTFFAAFWWDSFLLALLACMLQVLASQWLISLSGFKWDIYNPEFKLCFSIGVGCKVLGVFLLLLPQFGFGLFTFFYTIGNMCTLASLQFLMDFQKNTDNFFVKIKAQGYNVVKGLSTQSQKLSDWVKREVEHTDPGTATYGSSTQNLPELYRSEMGGIVEGLCALLFPTLGALLFFANAVGGLGGLGGIGGLGGLEKMGTSAENKPSNIKDKVDHKGRRELTPNPTEIQKLADKMKQDSMKILRYLILATVLWYWGLALLLWLSKCLLYGLSYIIRHYPTYIVGFIICFTVGAECTFLGMYLLFVPEVGLTPFSFCYSFGNVLILGSSMFLVGHTDQLGILIDRAAAMSVMLTILTLLAALWLKSFVLALLFCILHMLTTMWFCLSYIPYAREGTEKVMSFFTK